jgi:hypothetical protein
LASSVNEQVNQNNFVLSQDSLVIREIAWIAGLRSPLCDQNAFFVAGEGSDGLFRGFLKLDCSRTIREVGEFRPILRLIFEG